MDNKKATVDLGFWNQKGEYIEDFQELDEEETKTYILSQLTIDNG